MTVEPGEIVTLIGPNGSGKSTLLKLMTGIYRPTEGSIATEGRVAALIELGAGFHPDMTGRENIKLNGSILGLSRNEIENSIDTIIDSVVEGKKVSILGFGSFEPRERSARQGLNPKTGEKIAIPAKRVPAFTAGKMFKDRVQG